MGPFTAATTDYVGVLRALEKKLQIKGSRALIFGAGGSARAAAVALARSRHHGRNLRPPLKNAAKELARAVGGEVIPRRALRSDFCDAILNTTPVGMHPRRGREFRLSRPASYTVAS